MPQGGVDVAGKKDGRNVPEKVSAKCVAALNNSCEFSDQSDRSA